MKNGMRWFRPLPLLVSVALAGTSGICLAQNTNSGDLRGTALDPTGAIIPGVTVTVTDVDKGVTRTYLTDAAGLYDTGAIPEDHYIIKFSRDGFATYVRGPVTVTLGVQTIDGQMKVGEVSIEEIGLLMGGVHGDPSATKEMTEALHAHPV